MFLSHERSQHSMARRKKPKKGPRGDLDTQHDGDDVSGAGTGDESRQQSSLDAFAAIRDAVVSATDNSQEYTAPDAITPASIKPTTNPASTPPSAPILPESDALLPSSSVTSTTDSNVQKSVIEAAIISPANEVGHTSGGDEIRGDSPIRTFSMPSAGSVVHRPPTTDVDYHDLGELFADAPVPQFGDGMVFHRGILHELSGVSQLLDWVSEGDAVIVELSRIITRENEFAIAIDRLSTFIEGDVGGQIIQLTDSRLLLLPPGCRGIRGVETESFVAEA
jgi:hypothetical protein